MGASRHYKPQSYKVRSKAMTMVHEVSEFEPLHFLKEGLCLGPVRLPAIAPIAGQGQRNENPENGQDGHELYQGKAAFLTRLPRETLPRFDYIGDVRRGKVLAPREDLPC